jgi:flagellar basal-body rod modification protein FlgD
MTTLDTASALGATTGAGGAAKATGRAQIADNFQSFLTLLTTQLKNQSPLDPLDTNQFTQQLVQFASVEQQLKTNEQLTSILSAVSSSSTVSAANYVGLTVTADASTAALAKGSATWTIQSPKPAAKANVVVKDASGTTVATASTSLKAGTQTYTWDGRNGAGAPQPDGDYTIAVTAIDAAGQPVPVTTELSGKVTAVTISGGAPLLQIGSASVPLARVKTIAQL